MLGVGKDMQIKLILKLKISLHKINPLKIFLTFKIAIVFLDLKNKVYQIDETVAPNTENLLILFNFLESVVDDRICN